MLPNHRNRINPSSHPACPVCGMEQQCSVELLPTRMVRTVRPHLRNPHPHRLVEELPLGARAWQPMGGLE